MKLMAAVVVVDVSHSQSQFTVTNCHSHTVALSLSYIRTHVTICVTAKKKTFSQNVHMTQFVDKMWHVTNVDHSHSHSHMSQSQSHCHSHTVTCHCHIRTHVTICRQNVAGDIINLEEGAVVIVSDARNLEAKQARPAGE